MPTLDTILPNLIHVGALLYLICFLFRDQVLLRSFAVAGDLAYAAFYYSAASHPLWSAIYWIVPNMLINLVMIALLLRDRRASTLTDDEMTLFQNLKGISPGQFRRLMKAGHWHRYVAPHVLTREDQTLDHLHYVLSGTIHIEKRGRIFAAEPCMFVGELAYLRNKPATATVTVAGGATVVSWSYAELAKVMARDETLSRALGSFLSLDLAEKVAVA